jgi:hypothetical protein
VSVCVCVGVCVLVIIQLLSKIDGVNALDNILIVGRFMCVCVCVCVCVLLSPPS